MVTGSLVVPNALSLDARREFLAASSNAIEAADGKIEVDCPQLDEVEIQIMGMLVSIMRQAQRRGVRVVLLHPSRQLYRLLAQTGVETRFVIRA